jgi:hypothetical protein
VDDLPARVLLAGSAAPGEPMKYLHAPSMKRLSIAVSLAASMWACEGSNLRSPTAPTLALSATYTLSGVVTEEVTPTGQAPVSGARVQVSRPHLLPATTDTRGSYRIDGVDDGPVSVEVSALDYETVNRDVTIDGDTRLDIQVIRRTTYTLSGVVSEMTPTGQVPLEGVEVEENYHHAAVRTDPNGFYSFAGYPSGLGPSVGFSISFSSEGYQTATFRPTINGDTRLDVQLVR